MATWEDGPEYAPVERPTDFADAGAAPLSMAPPVVQMAALAPKDRPFFDQPPVPVAPLESLVAAPPETRDPQVPFAVASSTMTSDSAWGAVHWDAPATPRLVPRRPPHASDPARSAERHRPAGSGLRAAARQPLPRSGHAGLVRSWPVRGATGAARSGQP